MDRFKFRIWDKEEKRYVEEYLDREIMLSIDGILNACAYDFSGQRSIEDINKNNRFEVEFCTGLNDKNGKLIYEGDILEVKVFDKKNYNQKKQTYWTVEWHEHRNNHGFMVYGINRRWNAPVAINKLFNAEAVVVGNIHENKDLLGEE